MSLDRYLHNTVGSPSSDAVAISTAPPVVEHCGGEPEQGDTGILCH